MNAGEIEATLVPQGTFAEAIRAGGAGIAGILHAGRSGNAPGRGEGGARDRRRAPRPRTADPGRRGARLRGARRQLGNLWYRRTASNFNPLMATAATITIAEAGEVVAVGSWTRSRSSRRISTSTSWWRAHERERRSQVRIAARAARELDPGEIVNLGIGIPNLIPGHLGADTRSSCTRRTACSASARAPTRRSSIPT